MRKMIGNGALGAILLSAYCLVGARIAAADNHSQFDGIVIELKFPGSDGQDASARGPGSEEHGASSPAKTKEKAGMGCGDASSSKASERVGGGSGEQGGDGTSAFRGLELEIIVPGGESDGACDDGASKPSGKEASPPAKTGDAKGATSGDASSRKKNGRGQSGTASKNQKKPQKNDGKGDEAEIDLGDPQGDATKNLDAIQNETDDESGRVKEMQDESLKTLEGIRGSRRKESQPSKSPPCTSTSGNVGVTHMFIDGMKECECDGEACRWK